jgi:hypothetical protein
MNTSCKYCVFKVMRDGKQVDCELGRIGKFKENGAEIEEEDDYLIIKHRFCTALRTIAWAKKHRNPIEKVREEIAVQCDFIIYVGAPHSFNDIQRTIRTAIAQKIKPLSLRILVNTDDVNPNNIIDYLEEILPDALPFFVERVTIKDEHGKHRTRNACLDISADKCESTYYAVFNAGFEIPETFLLDLDYSLNQQLDRFCVLEPNKDGNGLVVQTQIHKLLMGNRPVKLKQYEDGELVGDNIVEKAHFFAEEQKNTHLIKKVTEVCQGM